VSAEQADLFGGALALPEDFIYRLDFLSVEEERTLLGGIAQLTLEDARYREYTARRRVAYFGFDYDFTRNRLGEAAPMPQFLHPLRDRMARWMGIAPEAFVHALVSEYRPGTPLGWHRDAPDFDRVAGVSLGGRARMRFRPYRKNEPPAKDKPLVLDLEPRSAYQMNGASRWRWQHSIPPTPELRYSITFRTLRKN
jgi:alkylated DNA repair dioxygenase AlkB